MGVVDGKVVLIAGGAKGIGRGMARCFAREGARVFIADVDVENGEATAAGLGELGAPGVFVKADLSNRDDVFGFVQKAVDATGRADVMINNAYALSAEVPFHEKTDAMLEKVLKGGFYPTWWGMHAVFPHMRAQGGGHIINMYSGDAESGAWFRADFVASKSAVLGITRNAAHEWARFKINCNIICPAAAGTVFAENLRKNPQHDAAFKARNPMGRMGDPEGDIGPVAVFLGSEASRYITGELIHVDGGQHLPRRQSKPADVDAFEREWQAGKHLEPGQGELIVIDVHAHLYTGPLLDYLKRDPATAPGVKRASLPGASDSDANLTERLAMMDAAGVARQFVSPPPAPYPRAEAEGVALAISVNDATMEFVAKQPDRFSGFACLPLPHVEASVAEVRRCLGEKRMAGVMLQCFCGALSAADEKFDPIYEEMDSHAAVLLLHPCVNGICSPFITEWGLIGSVGPTLEDTTIALHLIARKIPHRFPRIKIIIPHLGGGLPMLLKRLDHQMQSGAGALPEAPSLTSKRFWFDSVSHGSTAALHCAAEAFGADRLLIGSDFPFLTQYEPYSETVGYPRAAGLSGADLRQLETENAVKLFGLA